MAGRPRVRADAGTAQRTASDRALCAKGRSGAGLSAGLGAGMALGKAMTDALSQTATGGDAAQKSSPASATQLPDSSAPAPEGTKFCHNCGKSIARAAKFCPECGAAQG